MNILTRMNTFFFSHLVIFGRKGREGEGEAVEGS